MSLILALALPTLTTVHTNASETVVIREVQSIHQAQLQYFSQFGDYASTLAQLGPPADGIVGPHGAKLLPSTLTGGEKNGYIFTLTRRPGGYVVNANPKVFGKSGNRTFYIDEDGGVRQNLGPEPATINSPEMK